MEVEEETSSLDGDGFLVPKKFKRKSDEVPGVKSGDAEANLLKKNKFDKLADDKKRPKTTPVVTHPDKPSGKGKIPPLVVRNIDFVTLQQKMRDLPVKFLSKLTRKLREIKAVGNIVVRWEAYRNKRVDVTQCMSCLHFGHGTRNCYLKKRCNSCGGPHETDSCPDQEAPEKRCANCSGTHSATDRTCPKRAEYIRIRQNATTSNQPGRRPARNNPAVPALSTTNFPPLPSRVPAVPAQARMNIPPPSGSSSSTPLPGRPLPAGKSGGLDPRVRAASYAKPPSPVAEQEPSGELYSMAEIWAIHQEYSTRLKQCKNRHDQVNVVGYMLCTYGV